MHKFIAGVVTGALIVAGGTFAIMAAADPAPRGDPGFAPLLALKLRDAEQERDRLRLQVDLLKVENAVLKRQPGQDEKKPEKRID